MRHKNNVHHKNKVWDILSHIFTLNKHVSRNIFKEDNLRRSDRRHDMSNVRILKEIEEKKM